MMLVLPPLAFIFGGYTGADKHAPSSFIASIDLAAGEEGTANWGPVAAANQQYAPPALLVGATSAFDMRDGTLYIVGGAQNTGLIYRLRIDSDTSMAWLAPWQPQGFGPYYVHPYTSYMNAFLLPELEALVMFAGTYPDNTQTSALTIPLLVNLTDPSYYGVNNIAIKPGVESDFYLERFGCAGYAIGDGMLVLFGGQTRVGTDNVVQLVDMANKLTWTEWIGNRPPPVTLAGFSSSDDVFYVVGGATSRNVVWDNFTASLTPVDITAIHSLRACTAGTYFSAGTCLICPAGTFSGPGATSCTLCPAGSYSPLSGVSNCMYRCPSGHYLEETAQTSAAKCTACPAGTYLESDSDLPSKPSVCRLCPHGTFGNSSAQTSLAAACQPCRIASQCRWGSTAPTVPLATINVGARQPPDLSTPDALRTQLLIGLGSSFGAIALALLVAFIVLRPCRPKMITWSTRLDPYPGLLTSVDELHQPLKIRTCFGGVALLAMVVVAVIVTAVYAVRLLPDINNTGRENSLVEGLPIDSLRGRLVSVAIASIAHHGPCLANSSAVNGLCDPAFTPSLSTGTPNNMTCTLREDGTCLVNMTISLQLFGNSVIRLSPAASLAASSSVSASPLLYNSGWWWEILVGDTQYRGSAAPDGDWSVLHGAVGTAETVALTLGIYNNTKDDVVWSTWSLAQLGSTRLGQSADNETFYSATNDVQFSLQSVMNGYHQYTRDYRKDDPLEVFLGLIGSLSGAFGGISVAKSVADTAWGKLFECVAKRRKKKSGGGDAKESGQPRFAHGGPGAAALSVPSPYSQMMPVSAPPTNPSGAHLLVSRSSVTVAANPLARPLVDKAHIAPV